jgi:hypothetical protein
MHTDAHVDPTTSPELGTKTGVQPVKHPVTVTVNNHPVTLAKHKMTGLEIKQEAMAQGAELELNFQLSVKRGNHYDVITDDMEITVHEGQEFLAIAPDDNS